MHCTKYALALSTSVDRFIFKMVPVAMPKSYQYNEKTNLEYGSTKRKKDRLNLMHAEDADNRERAIKIGYRLDVLRVCSLCEAREVRPPCNI